MFDFDRFEQTAAWLEYCDGMSRFAAETESARRQGVKRHEAISMGRAAQARDRGEANSGHAADDLPRVQSHQAQQAGQVPVGNVQA